MEWYYAVNKQQVGPVNTERFAELLRQGIITSETPVWRQGMTAWLPYGQVANNGGTASPSGAPPLPGSTNLTPDQWERSLDAQDYDLKVGECFREGWSILQRNMPAAIGTTVLVWLTLTVISAIPVLGGLGQMAIMGPLFGGLACFYLKLVRGQDARVGDAFCGFGPRFLPAMLGGILISLMSALCFIPMIAIVVVIVFSLGLTSPEQFEHLEKFRQDPPWGMIGLAAFGLLITFVLMTVVSTLLQFSYALILDKGLDVMAAIRLSARRVWKHFGQMFLLVFLGGLVSGLGVLLCFVGMLFTVPWFLATMAVAYERIFPGRTSDQN